MRRFLTLMIGVLMVLIVGLLTTLPSAAAQDAPYPLFRRQGDVEVRNSDLTNQLKVGACINADRFEAYRGDEVRYFICVKSLYNGTLPPLSIAFFFDPNLMTVIDSGGATFYGNNVAWKIGSLAPGEEVKLSVRVRLAKNLRTGAVLTTYASLVKDNRVQPACAKHELVIIAQPPVTGAGDGTAPVENVDQFLRPVSAPAAPSGWIASVLSFFSR